MGSWTQESVSSLMRHACSLKDNKHRDVLCKSKLMSSRPETSTQKIQVQLPRTHREQPRYRSGERWACPHLSISTAAPRSGVLTGTSTPAHEGSSLHAREAGKGLEAIPKTGSKPQLFRTQICRGHRAAHRQDKEATATRNTRN